MNDNLKIQSNIPSDVEKTITTSQKVAYSSPALRVYGSVSKLTQTGAGSISDGSGNRMRSQVSDPRAKENIVRIGTHPLGIGLYLFDYLPEHREQWGHGRQFGVMADEVESVMAEAVSIHASGYKQVDYGMLGISHLPH